MTLSLAGNQKSSRPLIGRQLMKAKFSHSLGPECAVAPQSPGLQALYSQKEWLLSPVRNDLAGIFSSILLITARCCLEKNATQTAANRSLA